jgi:Protein of unknown function (DUF1579)
MKAFVGTWTMTVNNKGSLDPGAPPAGQCAGTETYEMLGEFFVVRNYEITCNGMRGKGLEIFRWDTAKKVYVVTAFGDGGGHGEFNVTAAGPTWSLLDRGVAKGKKYWHRCSFTFVSSDRVEHTCDDSADGKKWEQTQDGVDVRVK